MNSYLTADGKPSETLQYTLDYYGITLDEFKAMLDEQVVAMVKRFNDVLDDGRVRTSGEAYIGQGGNTEGNPFTKARSGGKVASVYADSGSFSRYFDLDKWWAERIKQLPASVQKTFPFLLVSKASKGEKNKGLDYKPQPIMGRDGGQDVLNVPQKARSTPRINQHPTVKPLKLMSYLITLGSREGDTVLDPFLGSGTTALACQLLNRQCIGIEISEEYCEIAKKRLSQSVLKLEG